MSRELWPEDVTDLSPPGEAAEKEIKQVAGGVVPLTQIIVFDPGGKILQPWKVRKVDEKCEKQKLKRQPRTVKKELKDKQTVQDANMKHSKTYPNVGSK